MSLISRTLYSNKFALANFILLNSKFCNITRDQLYVIQIVEQYQMQMNQTVSFTELENRIDISVDEFKKILMKLVESKLVITKIKSVNNLKTLFYNTNKFWFYAANKLVEFDTLQEKMDKRKQYIEIVSQKYNRFLNQNEIESIDQVIDIYNIDILSEILNQTVILNSKYVSTIVELVNVYKEANCSSIEEIRSEFEEFRN